MPVLISVYRMMYALRKPADATAVKDVMAFNQISFAPLAPANGLAINFLRPSPTMQALDAATK